MGDGWQWSLYSVCTHKHLQLVKVLSLTVINISRILLQATDSPMLLSSLLHSSANLTRATDHCSLAPSTHALARMRSDSPPCGGALLSSSCVYTALTGSYGLNKVN